MYCFAKFSLLIIVLYMVYMGGMAIAQTTGPLDPFQAAEQQTMRLQAIQQDSAEITRLRQELRALETDMPGKMAALQVGQLSQSMVEQARLDADIAKLRQQSLQVNIANTERRIPELQQSIRDLEAQEQLLQNPAKGFEAGSRQAEQLALTRQNLAQQRGELTLEKQNLSNLRSYLEIADLRQSLTEKWLARVEEVYRLQQAQTRLKSQEELVTRLEKKQQDYQSDADALRQRLNDQQNILSKGERGLLETQLEVAESRAKLVQLEIRLSQINNELANLASLATQTDVRAKTLQRGLEQVQEIQQELTTTDSLFRYGIPLAERQKQLLEQRDDLTGVERIAVTQEAKLIGAMLEELHQSRNALQSSLERAKKIQNDIKNRYQKRLSQDLLERENLPTSVADWHEIWAEIKEAPRILAHQVRLSIASTVTAMMETSALRWLMLIVVELGLLWLMWAALRSSNAMGVIDQINAKEEDSFFGAILFTTLQLLRQNLVSIYIALAVALALWLCQVPQPGFGIMMTLILLWLGIKIPVNLAWFLLAAPELSREQRHPQLYRQIVGTLILGGLLASVTILANLSDLPTSVTTTFDRLFMGYWLLAFVPVLRIRRLLVDLLAKRFGNHFWFISLRLITLLLPLSLVVAALLGLFGYIQLAWTVAWHWVTFIAVLVGWLSLRGLLKDLVIITKNYAITHSTYALLWTQDVINPLHKFLSVVLFLGAGLALLQVYGWESALLSTTLGNFLERPLFSLAGTEFNLWRILVILVVVLLVIRFSQWSRTVAYRWVFSGIIDLGVRHSLSVFTQYAIVLVGFLIALQIAGLNLTTLTVFAGAVGVGIGFGMQAIANNFVSGLLLLIERPLRSGDTVQIGNSTGEISRIGMRSLTLKTWDNMEVIIPNADVISNAFVNWTHTDTVVRTVLMVHANYDANPHQVREIIDDALFCHEEILREPAWAVLLWEFDNFGFAFRMQYFTDFAKSNTLKVRSEVMFAVYDGFKKANIEIPYPQQNLHIQDWPEQAARMRALDASKLDQLSLAKRTTNTSLPKEASKK
jgi:potassium efflux system protein